VGDNEIGKDKNEGKSLAILIAMAMHDAVVQREMHRPIEHVQGPTGSH
jgi:hypothetical protein